MKQTNEQGEAVYNKVYIEITNICNMNCSFCHGHKRAPKQMTESEFSYVLDKISRQTEYIYYHLMGEPLTHPNILKFLRLAGERGFKSIITTNGTLLKKRGIDLLNEPLHKVNISVHSFEKGSEEDHVRYISEIADFAKNASEKGIIVVLRLWNKGVDGGKNANTLELLKDFICGEWKENARGIKIREKLFLEWGERFEWPDIDADIKGDRFFCYGLKDQFGILVDGTVVPCCLDSDGVIKLGNVFDEDIETILNSKRATDIVNSFKCFKASEDLCKKCGYAQRFVLK